MQLVPTPEDVPAEAVADSGRRAARVPADRRSVVCELVGHGFALRGLVAIDVSAAGCLLSGSGNPPPIGSMVRLDICATTYGAAEAIDADVVRLERGAFGRYVVGLQFAAVGGTAYERILASREACRERDADVAAADAIIG